MVPVWFFREAVRVKISSASLTSMNPEVPYVPLRE